MTAAKTTQETLATTTAARYLIPGDVVRVPVGTMTVIGLSVTGDHPDGAPLPTDQVTLVLDCDTENPVIWTVGGDEPVDVVTPMPDQAEPAWVYLSELGGVSFVEGE